MAQSKMSVFRISSIRAKMTFQPPTFRADDFRMSFGIASTEMHVSVRTLGFSNVCDLDR